MKIREHGGSRGSTSAVIIVLGDGWNFPENPMVREFASIGELEERLIGEQLPVVLYNSPMSPDVVQVLFRLNREKLLGVRLFMQVSAGDFSLFVNVETGEVVRTYDRMPVSSPVQAAHA